MMKCPYKTKVTKTNPYGCGYNANLDNGGSPIPECSYPVTFEKVKMCLANESTEKTK